MASMQADELAHNYKAFLQLSRHGSGCLLMAERPMLSTAHSHSRGCLHLGIPQ